MQRSLDTAVSEWFLCNNSFKCKCRLTMPCGCSWLAVLQVLLCLFPVCSLGVQIQAINYHASFRIEWWDRDAIHLPLPHGLRKHSLRKMVVLAQNKSQAWSGLYKLTPPWITIPKNTVQCLSQVKKSIVIVMTSPLHVSLNFDLLQLWSSALINPYWPQCYGFWSWMSC